MENCSNFPLRNKGLVKKKASGTRGRPTSSKKRKFGSMLSPIINCHLQLVTNSDNYSDTKAQLASLVLVHQPNSTTHLMEQFQAGVTFRPTEEELISHHLMRKVLGYADDCVIPELEDFYACDPWDLPRVHQGISNVPSDGWDWFFLCPSPYYARNSERVKRKTRSGNWKITSQRDEIRTRDTRALIGSKRILTFYQSRAKRGWVMHEYHLNPELLDGYSSILQIPYILCRLKRKPEESYDITPSCEEGSSVTDDAPVASQHEPTEDRDPERSYQETLGSLSQLEILDDNPPDYSSRYSYVLQPDVYDNGQGNDFFHPWG